MDLLQHDAARDLPGLRDTDQQIPFAAQDGDPRHVLHLRHALDEPGRGAGLRLHVDVARPGDDGRRLHVAEPGHTHAVGGTTGAVRSDDPVDPVEL